MTIQNIKNNVNALYGLVGTVDNQTNINTSNISSNTLAISNIQTQTNINTSNISSNTLDISSNTSAISGLTSSLNNKLDLTGGTLSPLFPIIPAPTLLTVNGNIDLTSGGNYQINGVPLLIPKLEDNLLGTSTLPQYQLDYDLENPNIGSGYGWLIKLNGANVDTATYTTYLINIDLVITRQHNNNCVLSLNNSSIGASLYTFTGSSSGNQKLNFEWNYPVSSLFSRSFNISITRFNIN